MADKRERNEAFIREHCLRDLAQFIVMMLLFDKPQDVEGYCAALLSDIIDGRYDTEIPLYKQEEIEEMFKQYLLPNAKTIEGKQARECLLSMGIPENIAKEVFADGDVEKEAFVQNAILALHKRIAQWK